MRRIAILNQKGGVGKTTSTVNLAAALAAEGHKTLILDLDPQAHATLHLGLLPGRSYTHPDPITEAGTYTYRVAEGEPYQGSVLLRGTAITIADRSRVSASTEWKLACPASGGAGRSPRATACISALNS